MRHGVTRVLVLAAAWASLSGIAWSQTTGTLNGVVLDDKGAPVGGAMVVATSPSMQGQQKIVTGADGRYRLPLLPPGVYSLAATKEGAGQAEQKDVLVQVDRTYRVDLHLGMAEMRAGEVVVTARAPAVDQGSNVKGIVLSADYLRSVPSGRQVNQVLDIAPGIQRDQFGLGSRGATSPENQWAVEGMNTTGLLYGGITSDYRSTGVVSGSLPTLFVSQIDVKNGDYGAEFGRSNGAVVNAVTKSGGNELHGTLQLAFNSRPWRDIPRPRDGAVIRDYSDGTYNEYGVSLGGYLQKDTLWFHLGLVFSRQDARVRKIIRQQTAYTEKGGTTLFDPAVDDPTYVEKETREYHDYVRLLQPTLKLTYALAEDHSIELFYKGDFNHEDGWIGSIGRDETSGMQYSDDTISDYSVKLNSKLFNKNVLFELQAFRHGRIQKNGPMYLDGWRPQRVFNARTNLEWFEPKYVNDQSTAWIDYPVTSYSGLGMGYYSDMTEDRTGFRWKASNQFSFYGTHDFTVGGDWVDNQTVQRYGYTGGHWQLITVYGGANRGTDNISPAPAAPYTRYNPVTNPAATRRQFLVHGGPDPSSLIGTYIPFDELENIPGYLSPPWNDAPVETVDASLWIQESYTPVSNATLTLGLRRDGQDILGTEALRAIRLSDTFSPRFSAMFDWTNSGKSKLGFSIGRYHAWLPMDINVRSFGKEGYVREYMRGPNFNTGLAPRTDSPPGNCMPPMAPAPYYCANQVYNAFNYGGNTLVARPDMRLQTDSNGNIVWDAAAGHPRFFSGTGPANLEPQATDQWSLTYEHEVLPDLALGASYLRSFLVRALEDMSVDGGNQYFIANPGEGAGSFGAPFDFTDAEANVDANGNPQLRPVAVPKARRSYRAFELDVTKRFSDGWRLFGSYINSKLEGNWVGQYKPDYGGGQLDPGITADFDLVEFGYNAFGLLNSDYTHQLKLGGNYEYAYGPHTASVGGVLQYRSGGPINVVGPQWAYGNGVMFLLPRGAGGRLPGRMQFDLNLSYYISVMGKKFKIGLDIFNLTGSDAVTSVDTNFTSQALIETAIASDLAFLAANPGVPAPCGFHRAVTDDPNNSSTWQTPLTGGLTSVRPIFGGTMDDLQDSDTMLLYNAFNGMGYGLEYSVPVSCIKNPNFNVATAKQLPRYVQLTLSMDF